MVYDDKKLGTELNLALNTPLNELNKSLDLRIGYDEEFDEWELIIRYIGSLSEISSKIGFEYTELLNGYAIIRIKSEKIDELSNKPEIIFIEKPKGLYFEQRENIEGFNESCMNYVNIPPYNLTGKEVLVAVIDSGIDYRHPAFISSVNPNRLKSKIYGIWDQTIYGNPPDGFNFGSYFSNEDIENAINDEGDSFVITNDISGHGTGVASIISACAKDVRLLIVKLNNTDKVSENQFTKTTSLMSAIDFCIREAININLPLVINLSLGNNYGDHNSNSIVENYINSVANIYKLSFVIGTGNDGNTDRHAQIMLGNTSTSQIDFLTGPFETAINLQIWRSFTDVIDISLITPSGREIGPFNKYQEVMDFVLSNMYINVLNGYPTPINKNQETYISIIPKETYIEEGIWKILIRPRSISDGRVDVWLPVSGSTSSDVRFLKPSEYTTLTIPSTAIYAISVGAYNQRTLSYAAFSGRGYTTTGIIKPEISAPGVNITVAIPGGGYGVASGTSFAAPFVSAGVAMLMQWGITDGNDPFLYGEKVKAYIINGARKLPGYKFWPNPYLGYGALCVSDSIP